MNYCIHKPELPKIPKELIESLEQVEAKYENSYVNKDIEDMYTTRWTGKELTEWLQPYFDYSIATKYQIMKCPLVLHTDRNVKTGWKHIYIVSTGGDAAITRWWDSKENPQKIMYEEHMKLHEWYYINVDEPHEVIGIEYPRINIVVRHKE